MTEREMSRLLLEKFKDAGLLSYLVRQKQQVVEVPEGFFVEVVLSDGSKIEEAEELIARVRAELKGRGAKIIPIVRALWSVERVEKGVGPVDHKTGQFKAALDFNALLRSGTRTTQVTVQLTYGVFDELKEKLNNNEQQVRQKIREFLEFQLSIGGAGYWNPIRYPCQIMNDAGALYVLTHGPVPTRISNGDLEDGQGKF